MLCIHRDGTLALVNPIAALTPTWTDSLCAGPQLKVLPEQSSIDLLRHASWGVLGGTGIRICSMATRLTGRLHLVYLHYYTKRQSECLKVLRCTPNLVRFRVEKLEVMLRALCLLHQWLKEHQGAVWNTESRPRMTGVGGTLRLHSVTRRPMQLGHGSYRFRLFR
jgi:hypothetical protein